MSNKMTDMAIELRDLKARKDALAEETKTINKRITVLTETELPEYMENNEIEKVTIEGVGTLFLQTQFYVNVKAGDRPALYEALKAGGNEDMVVEYVWPNTLKAWAKDEVFNNRALPEMITSHEIQTAMLRKKS